MADRLPSLDALFPGLTRAGLTARLKEVLKFAQINVADIDRHAPFWPEESRGIVTQADKVVVETALLSLLASRARDGGAPLDDEIASLIALLGPLARSESNQVRLLRFPQTAASIGIAHICLSGLGSRDDVFDALIRQAFSSGHVEAIERLPYRAMDLAWLRGIHDVTGASGAERFLPDSILTSCAHPLHMAEMDAYAVTHALMYLTDFGACAVPAGVCLDKVSGQVDACLAWHILTGNMDLLGELLVSAALLRAAWSPYARLAMRMLLSVWDEFGFLPSAAFDAGRYRTLAGDAARAYAFLHVYHTTYVAGILCQVLLRCPERAATLEPWAPATDTDPTLLTRGRETLSAARAFCASRRIEISNDAGHAALPAQVTLERTLARIRSYPGICGRSGAPWLAAATDTELATADLALVLNDALLVQAARDYNLSVLVAALLDRATSALPLSATLLETTAFLCRQQLPSGAIGAHFVVPQNQASSQAAEVTAALAGCIGCLLAYIQEQEHGLRRSSQHAIRVDRTAGHRHQPSQGVVAP